ncbi:uncharacterized protein LOC128317503 [Pangasianodon hypophthalmus]|uniref:uncharacterized protein LOC128317503 n=1 Tax=Pangasianodon hypophthalmus TaxID=310915 RepID=UPI002307DDD8|nr:uncharacterized protein LOC128317503 [Pangasianodon hypophthalmus]
MAENECIIHVDFSENYICKYASEIQAVHFGASHEQATLHTGVLYVGPDAEPVCFSTISPSRLKGPPAIWEHLSPILSYVKNLFPAVTVVHFLSDGPCTQYHQKGNFYLFTSLLHKKGFQAGTWNFFEASHGKGATDGVGGVMNRSADQLVSHGCDIHNAMGLFEALVHTGTTLKLFYVSEESIDRAMKDMPYSIPQVPSTMRIHQVVTTSPGHMLYRDVSCMCTVDKILQCTCYNTKAFSFNTPSTPTTEEMTLQEGPEVIQKWCVIKYDRDIYPGIITSIDEVQVQVRCMHHVGVN